jgi:hypothetical protein
VRDISRSGIEIGSHGYLHEGIDPGDASRTHTPAIDRDHRHCSERMAISVRSQDRADAAQASRLGCVYDSSDKDFDLSYLACYDGEERNDYVCLPNSTSSLDDFPFYRVSNTPPSEVLAHRKQEFDAIHEEVGYFNLTTCCTRIWCTPCATRA